MTRRKATDDAPLLNFDTQVVFPKTVSDAQKKKLKEVFA
jgi:hypothetical protein